MNSGRRAFRQDDGAAGGIQLRLSPLRRWSDERRRKVPITTWLRLMPSWNTANDNKHPRRRLSLLLQLVRGGDDARTRMVPSVLRQQKSHHPTEPPEDEPQQQQQQQPPSEWLEFVDPNILGADIVAVAIACQFMGLMDVLSDVDFWKNGGWFQPIIISGPSTLPVLVQRFSLNTVLWVLASLGMGGHNNDSTTGTTSAIETTTGPTTQQGILVAALQTSGIYSVLRMVAGAGLSWMLSENPAFSWDWFQILRECYIVSLTAIAARYVVFGIVSR